MVVIQFPAGMPEHNLLANEIGNYLKPRLGRELTVLYDTYCYISHEMLERLGHRTALGQVDLRLSLATGGRTICSI